MTRFVDKDHENFNRIEKRRMPEEERHKTDGEENQQLAEVQWLAVVMILHRHFIRSWERGHLARPEAGWKPAPPEEAPHDSPASW